MDAIADGAEDADKDGAVDAGETSPLDMDSDDDGLTDGQELGVVAPGPHTDMTKFVRDSDPTTTTGPLDTDTDDDGIWDNFEDANKNGRVDSGEPNPNQWDTDGDSLPDGWVEFGTAGQGSCTGVCLDDDHLGLGSFGQGRSENT